MSFPHTYEVYFRTLKSNMELQPTKAVGDVVSFLLDGKRAGSGVVVATLPDREERMFYVVKLLEPCKEFTAGSEIIVDEDEITEERKQDGQ